MWRNGWKVDPSKEREEEGKEGGSGAGRRKGERVGHPKGAQRERVHNEKGRAAVFSDDEMFV